MFHRVWYCRCTCACVTGCGPGVPSILLLFTPSNGSLLQTIDSTVLNISCSLLIEPRNPWP